MGPLMRAPLPLTVLALLAVPLAGCIGGIAGDGGPLNAAFSVEQAGGTTYVFDASGSGGSDLTYAWDFGDGATATGEVVEHTFPSGDGYVSVMLTVTDGSGETDREVQGVRLGTGQNDPPDVTVELSSDWVATGEPVTATATVSDPEGDDYTIQWAYGDPAPPPPPHGEDPNTYDPVDNDFDSPEIDGDGDTYNLNISGAGVYTYHCHPHPWMTGAIIVADDPAALEGTVELTAANIREWLPQKLMVKPGTDLVFENPDPTWHSVTLSLLHPLTDFVEADGPDGTSATLSLEETGDYSLFAIVTDSKGDVTVENALFRVSDEVPESEVTETFTGNVTTPTDGPSDPLPDHPQHETSFEFPGNATVTFEWSALTPDPVTDVRLEVYQGSRVAGTPVLNVTSGSADLRLAADSYILQVVNEVGLLVDYTITIDAVLDVTPDFGGAGECPEPHKSLGHC